MMTTTTEASSLLTSFVEDIMNAKEDSDARVGDTGLTVTERELSEVALNLTSLPAGHYLVMWRALSDDTPHRIWLH